jgi:hypothetical protein
MFSYVILQSFPNKLGCVTGELQFSKVAVWHFCRLKDKLTIPIYLGKNGEVVPVFKHHAVKIYEGWRYSSSFGGKSPFYPLDRKLDGIEKRRFPVSSRNRSSVIHPSNSHFTD